MARLFLSHSSLDIVQAVAFQNWLAANGWERDDVFLDLHSIGAGENWRLALRKANARCEAVILLASPESLASVECQKELELAEALGKEIIVAILRDLKKNDPQLARYSERQFIDLSASPKDRLEPFEFEGKTCVVEFGSQALAAIKARLDDLGIAPGSFAWPPKGTKDPEPYSGLSAFSEDDAGIFFGREADILSALTEIRQVRRRRSPRLIVIDAASGAGKSSFLRAGLWPRLKRDPDFAPLGILRPAQGIITGPDGFGRRLSPYFDRFGQPRAAGAIHGAINNADLAAAILAMKSLLADATKLAWEARRAAVPDAPAPAVLLAVDQGEELFAAENDAESRRFLELLAAAFKHTADDFDPYLIVTIRADSAHSLLDRVAELELETPKAIYLPPLSPTAYRDVILKPAAVYSDRVRRLTIEPTLANELISDTTGADALPLLSFTLSRLFSDYGVTGELTLTQYREMGGVSGSIGRALKDALGHAGAAGTNDKLRRLIVPRLATWDPEANQQKGAAKCVVASLDSVIGGNRADLEDLANALVAARLLTLNRATLEVAHEALLRQAPISEWLEEDREFLVWRDRLTRDRETYENNLRGFLAGRELQIAQQWLQGRPQDDIAPDDRKFILDSAANDNKRQAQEEDDKRLRQRLHRRAQQMAVLLVVLFVGIAAGVAWADRAYLEERAVELEERLFPQVLSAAAERALKPGDAFKECSDCPEMVVVPAGDFTMGSPDTDTGRSLDEGPMHQVTIAHPFAVGRFAVTFEEWDACFTIGACTYVLPDEGWGRGTQPAVNVNRAAAEQYVTWLAARTGRPYRLLSESEFEYAARSNTETPYWWGADVGSNNANCNGCRSAWELKGTAPVGSFKANGFGLYDMNGNTWTWVDDCYHENYVGAPADGSAWVAGIDCTYHVVRGGGWYSDPTVIRAPNRGKSYLRRQDALGLRLARTLAE